MLRVAGLLVLIWSLIQVARASFENDLYRDLFADYDVSMRPVPGRNVYYTVDILIGFGLRQIEKLNEREQELISHGFMALEWNDPALAWNSTQYGGLFQLVVSAKEVWLPEITPFNSVVGATELSEQKLYTRVKIISNGRVYWTPAVKWETSCSIDVREFPYDTQECIIEYANWVYGGHMINFTATSPKADISALSENLEWKIISTEVWTKVEGEGWLLFPFITMKVKMKRDPRFFEMNVLLPTMLLSFLLIPMFMLPVDSGEKVSLGITIMLAYSIFLLMMTDVTPKSGASPRLTELILANIMWSGMSIVLSVLVINVHHHSTSRKVPHIVKDIFLKKIGGLIFRMNYVDENEVTIMAFEKRDLTNNKNKKEKQSPDELPEKPNVKGLLSGNLNDVDNYQEYFKMRKMEKDEEASIQNDWHNLARVLDRCFLLLYTLLFLANIVTVFFLKNRGQNIN